MTDSFPQIIPFLDTPPPLTHDQVHLMVAALDSLADYRRDAEAALDTVEQARAARFLNPTHGDNFRLVRGVLRLCLQSYLGIPPADIHFQFNAHGKPAVDVLQNTADVHFNVSHSQNMAAFAFALGKPVGVDIEAIKPVKNIVGLANHVCSPKELEEFSALESDRREEAFFRLWTRKEAYVKAQGQGLSMGLRSIYIGFDVSRTAHPVQYKNTWQDQWLVKDWECDANYKLAIAMGGLRQIRR